MRVNTLATEARNDYRERPYFGPRPLEAGAMSGGFAETRDSDALEQSNFAVAYQRYLAAGCEVTIDRFGHWAVGWIDYLTVRITTESVRVLTELRDAVENYPVLDDDDFTEREWSNDHPGDGRCYSESCSEWEQQDGERPCGLPAA